MAFKEILSSLVFLGVVLFVVGSPRRKYATPQQLKTHCSSYHKSCLDDIECQCDYPGAKMICNYKKVCDKISFADIMRRIPCPSKFKSSCNFDEDCRTSECPSLICEDNECIEQKNIIT